MESESLEEYCEEIKFDVERVTLLPVAIEVNAPEDELIVLKYLKRRMLVEAELTRIKDQMGAMVKELETKLAGLDYVYAGHAEKYAKEKIGDGKKRSFKTPFATVGFRKNPPKLVVEDEEKLIKWAKSAKLDKLIRVRESVDKAAVDGYAEESGEVPVGCSMVAEFDKFYIK